MAINLLDYTQEDDEEIRLPEMQQEDANAIDGGEALGSEGAEGGLGAASDGGTGAGEGGMGAGGEGGGQGASGGMGAGA